LPLILAAGTWHTVTSAQEPATPCGDIEDDQTRLACYDAASGRPDRTNKSADAVGLPQQSAPTAVALPALAGADGPAPPSAHQSAATFGLSAEQQSVAESGPGKITARVDSVAAQSHIGRWTVTLDNGQVWQQRETTAETNRPQPGDQVTISKAALGSFLLYAPGRGLSRVKRVR
jgi:hypothetical protein